MERIRIAPSYSRDYLEVTRPQPMMDAKLESLAIDVLNGKAFRDISDKVYDDFKNYFTKWLAGSTLNKLDGLNKFGRIDIINGCTQYIDNLYMQGPVQTIHGDYRYHQRLGLGYIKDVGSLIPSVPLIIAMPFPRIGAPHTDMEEILNEAHQKGIDVHVDGAWVTCCRNINFNLDHPAIKSVGISLSKGLGLGWNRIGLRWSRQFKQDSITIMNDFRMNNRALSIIGLYFLSNTEPDYLWKTHELRYNKVCMDFNLTPTNSIYLALDNGSPVGVTPLMRYLIEHG